jgi:hypothetical protein
MKLDRQDKKQFLEEHFYYEVLMLRYSIEKFMECGSIGDNLGMNLCMEALITHSRLLAEFFFFTSDKSDYARAGHFIDNWDKVRPIQSISINKLLERSNTEIVHLTYRRIAGNPNEKEWNLGSLYNELLEIVELFLNSLDTDLLGNNLSQLKSGLATDSRDMQN